MASPATEGGEGREDLGFTNEMNGIASQLRGVNEADNGMLNLLMMNKGSVPETYSIKQEFEDIEEHELQRLSHPFDFTKQSRPSSVGLFHVNRLPIGPSHVQSSYVVHGPHAQTPYSSSRHHLSKSVPTSPTFAAGLNTQHYHHLISGGGGMEWRGAGAIPGPSAAFPDIFCFPASSCLSAASTQLAASLDLASCTSSMSPEVLRSANVKSDSRLLDIATNGNFVGTDEDGTAVCNELHTERASPPDPAGKCSSANFGAEAPPLLNRSLSAKRRRLQLNAPTAGLDVASASSSPSSSAVASMFPSSFPDQNRPEAQIDSAEMSTNNSPIHINEGSEDPCNIKPNLGGLLQPATTTETTPTPATTPTTSSGSGAKPLIADGAMEPQQQATPPPPPPKQDYIHVRARRGQATDSHSLAERVRREKISERMKFLQDLVPGCNKITGKAVMLDEIINYVQSLQRQVEFLSMKLSTVSPPNHRYETNSLMHQGDPQAMQMNETNINVNSLNHHDHQHPHHLQQLQSHQSMPLILDVQQSAQQDPSKMNGSHVWEDELQSLVQMGYPTLS